MKRRKQTFFSALTTLALLSAVGGVRADDHSKDEALIRAAMNKMANAFENKDADAYVVFTAPDFVNIDLSGKETTHGKKERRASLSRLFSRVSTLKEHSTAKSITFDKEGATVIQVSDASYSANVDGQNRVLRSHSTYRDFWVKGLSGWLEKKSRTVSSKRTLDGHPIP